MEQEHFFNKETKQKISKALPNGFSKAWERTFEPFCKQVDPHIVYHR